jgi:hypothetical protein
MRLHRISQEIAGKIGPAGHQLTLGPLYALEGKGEIYPELANPFSYRVADRLSAEERAITHTVGAASLSELTRDPPVAAVIVGVEPPYLAFLEDTLRKLAPPDWPRDTYGNGIQVYRRP